MYTTPTKRPGSRGGSSTCSSRQASSSGVEPDVDDITLLGSNDGSNIERDGRITLRRDAHGENSITSTDVERDNAILQNDCKTDKVQLEINPAACKASVF
ncbi:hypothetical protein OROMI_019838 [Orobanche minor]